MKKINMLGWKMSEHGVPDSRLTVIGEAKTNKYGYAQWLCQCDCGNTIVVTGKHLRTGNTKSCGCLQKEIMRERHRSKHIDMIGQTYGYLKVLDYGDYAIKPDGRKDQKMKCQCELCGTIIEVRSSDLKLGNQISCGCIHSKGNTKINLLLQERKINFKREYKIEECKDIHPLPFDFAFFNFNNELIGLLEYQGIQHFTCENHGWDRQDKFEIVKKHDKQKFDFCKENNIKLYYITYQENIEEKLKEILNELYS